MLSSLLPRACRSPDKVTVIRTASSRPCLCPSPRRTPTRRARLGLLFHKGRNGRLRREKLTNGETTTVRKYIQQATDIARRMVCEWGMSDELGYHLRPGDEPSSWVGDSPPQDYPRRPHGRSISSRENSENLSFRNRVDSQRASDELKLWLKPLLRGKLWTTRRSGGF
jgi:hypothetical protein